MNNFLAACCAIAALTLVVLALCFLSYLLVHDALKKGKTGIQGWPEASRKDTPTWFWICVILQGAIGPIVVAAVVLNA
jgi:hypothetical protein